MYKACCCDTLEKKGNVTRRHRLLRFERNELIDLNTLDRSIDLVSVLRRNLSIELVSELRLSIEHSNSSQLLSFYSQHDHHRSIRSD